mmetsp:Transcript_20080/g.57441  ORF Transcript_20080/g.57441 Transcript_20080/m.57441 type:complete len:412 (+) Transcript_20080:3-1238(+)
MGYVWGGGEKEPAKALPRSLAVPWTCVSRRLGLPPIVTHVDMDLWNWAKIDKDEPFTPENLKCHSHFTGSRSEEWFHLVPCAIEHAGTPLVNKTFDLATHLNQLFPNGPPSTPKPTPDTERITAEYLSCVSTTLTEMTALIRRMREGCDPREFYLKQRPFLAGFGSSEALPDGLVYEGVSTEPLKFNGASAGQSSLVQMFDVLLGVRHRDPFLAKMRQYMPADHRMFLEALEPLGEALRGIVGASGSGSGSGDHTLARRFDECLDKLAAFRSAHMGLVHTYIIQMKREQAAAEHDHDQDHHEAHHAASKAKGTGGTELIPFLKQCKEETTEAKLNHTIPHSHSLPQPHHQQHLRKDGPLLQLASSVRARSAGSLCDSSGSPVVAADTPTCVPAELVHGLAEALPEPDTGDV